MRTLFHVLGADGHLLPVVPLARDLVAAGHDVSFAVDRQYCGAVESRGFRALPLDPPVSMGSAAAVEASLALEGLDRLRYQVEGFLEAAVSNSRQLVDYAHTERPHVLIRDSTGWGAWLAGEQLDLPVATFDYAPARPGFFEEVLGDLFASARMRVGLGPQPDLESLHRWLTLVGAPPDWFPPGCFRATTHLLQPPEDPLDGGDLPDWFVARPNRPTVYATLGTVFNETPGVFELVLDAVRDLDINVVATVGRTADPAAFTVPDHIHIARFIPQALVLERCDAVVAHGGYGSLMGALRRGLPIVVIPLAAGDNHLNAARVEQLGAGIAVRDDGRSAAEITKALTAILDDPCYRRAARGVAAGIARLPPFSDAVVLVERLASERRPIVADNRM